MNEAIAENAWPIGPFDLQESGIATASRHGACAVAAASHGTVLRGAEPSRTRVGWCRILDWFHLIKLRDRLVDSDDNCLQPFEGTWRVTYGMPRRTEEVGAHHAFDCLHHQGLGRPGGDASAGRLERRWGVHGRVDLTMNGFWDSQLRCFNDSEVECDPKGEFIMDQCIGRSSMLNRRSRS